MRSNQPDYTDYSTDMIQAIERQRDEFRDERDFWKLTAESFFNQRNRLWAALHDMVDDYECETAISNPLLIQAKALLFEISKLQDDNDD